LRLRIALGLPFEVGRGDVIQQHVIVHGKQLAHPPGQVRLECRFVRQQLVERAIQPVFVHQRLVQLQQIAQRRAPVPILGNVQFARWLAQAGRDQHRGHLLPRHRLFAGRNMLGCELIESAGAPQSQRQIHLAELPAVFDAHTLELHRNRLAARAVVKQARLLGLAYQRARQSTRAHPPRFIQFAKMRDRLLNHAPPDPHRTHQPPSAMDLAVFLARRVAQIHEHASERTPIPLARGKVGTTRRFASHIQCKSMIPFTPASRKM
jgi:hypothetical protein